VLQAKGSSRERRTRGNRGSQRTTRVEGEIEGKIERVIKKVLRGDRCIGGICRSLFK